jgi:hypothetical protein
MRCQDARAQLAKVTAAAVAGVSLGAALSGVASAHLLDPHPYHYAVYACDTWGTHWHYGATLEPVADTQRQGCGVSGPTIGVQMKWQHRVEADHGTGYTSWKYDTDGYVWVGLQGSYKTANSIHQYVNSSGYTFQATLS